MSNNALGIIYFIACSHALMLAVSLWMRTTKNSPARLLSILAELIAYKLFEGGTLYTGAYVHFAHAMDLLPGEVLIFGPLYYLYVCSVNGQRPFAKTTWLLHFLPAGVLWLYNSGAVFTSYSNKVAMWESSLAVTEVGPIAMQWVILLLAIKAHLTTYLYLSWQQIHVFEKTVDNLRADDSKLALNKMRTTVVAFFALELVWVGLFVGRQFFGIGTLNLVSEVWLLFVAIAVLALGFVGLQKPNLVFDREERALADNTSADHYAPIKSVNKDADNVKYLHSALPQDTLNVLAQEVEAKLKQEHLYLNSGLTITDLSKATGIRSHTLSQVITQSMNTNFYRLVNSYRVQHAVALIEDKSINWPLERIALESGFGNRVTFSKTFKETLSCTPSAYKKRVSQAS